MKWIDRILLSAWFVSVPYIAYWVYVFVSHKFNVWNVIYMLQRKPLFVSASVLSFLLAVVLAANLLQIRGVLDRKKFTRIVTVSLLFYLLAGFSIVTLFKLLNLYE